MPVLVRRSLGVKPPAEECILVACEKCQVASLGLLDQRLGEEQHQRNDEPVVRQRLEEREGQEQHAAEIVGNLRLAADAVEGGHQRGAREQRGRGQGGEARKSSISAMMSP